MMRSVLLHSIMLVGAACSTQYILFSPSGSPGDCSNNKDYVAVFKGVNAALNTSVPKNAPLRPGVHLLFNILNCPTEVLEVEIKSILDAAVSTETPVLFGLDPQVWWEKSYLWNWFDPQSPGYDPQNWKNVESTSWDLQASALKISWLNWSHTQIA